MYTYKYTVIGDTRIEGIAMANSITEAIDYIAKRHDGVIVKIERI